MIAQLKGMISHKATDHVVVDVGGVGYHVVISLSSFDKMPPEGEEVTLFIHTHVREDQITLFGFTSVRERAIFKRLISVSGVGPKLALSVLSGLAPKDLIDSVIKEDLTRINAIPGIGKKTAERIVIDLKDKFVKEFGPVEMGAEPAVSGRPLYDDAMSALMNLGYKRAAAEKVMAGVSLDDKTTVQSVIKAALRSMPNGNS